MPGRRCKVPIQIRPCVNARVRPSCRCPRLRMRNTSLTETGAQDWKSDWAQADDPLRGRVKAQAPVSLCEDLFLQPPGRRVFAKLPVPHDCFPDMPVPHDGTGSFAISSILVANTFEMSSSTNVPCFSENDMFKYSLTHCGAHCRGGRAVFHSLLERSGHQRFAGIPTAGHLSS
eukprot:gene20967-biopygen7054